MILNHHSVFNSHLWCCSLPMGRNPAPCSCLSRQWRPLIGQRCCWWLRVWSASSARCCSPLWWPGNLGSSRCGWPAAWATSRSRCCCCCCCRYGTSGSASSSSKIVQSCVSMGSFLKRTFSWVLRLKWVGFLTLCLQNSATDKAKLVVPTLRCFKCHDHAQVF